MTPTVLTILFSILYVFFFYGDWDEESAQERSEIRLALESWDYVCPFCEEEVSPDLVLASSITPNEPMGGTKSKVIILGHEKCIKANLSKVLSGEIDYKSL